MALNRAQKIAASFSALGLMAATPFAGSALADDARVKTEVRTVSAADAENVNFAVGSEGKPVELIYGSGFSSLQAKVAERTIENAGCPTDSQILGDGDQMMVNVAGRMVIVTDDMLDAASEAIEHCVPGQS